MPANNYSNIYKEWKYPIIPILDILYNVYYLFYCMNYFDFGFISASYLSLVPIP